jgi:hypothetical protein
VQPGGDRHQQVLCLDYDRAGRGMQQEPVVEDPAIGWIVQPEAKQPAQPKRSRRKQAA